MLDSMRRHIGSSDQLIGKVKPSMHNLPPSDHAYGLPYKRDEYGAGESKCIK